MGSERDQITKHSFLNVRLNHSNIWTHTVITEVTNIKSLRICCWKKKILQGEQQINLKTFKPTEATNFLSFSIQCSIDTPESR